MPKKLGRKYFETVPGIYTMTLMWRATKPLWVTGKVLITDSGFCALKGLIWYV